MGLGEAPRLIPCRIAQVTALPEVPAKLKHMFGIEIGPANAKLDIGTMRVTNN